MYQNFFLQKKKKTKNSLSSEYNEWNNELDIIVILSNLNLFSTLIIISQCFY